jgi:flagella basal body P-ring formation protein FlgA
VSLGFSLVLLLAGDAVVLKEKVAVSGRWVRAVDLVDSKSAALSAFADVYLGRSPEEGETRIITVEEIRRELDRHGLDPAAFAWQGDRVEVRSGAAPASEPLRLMIAAEVKRHVMAREPGDVSVRVVQLQPETCPEGCRVVEIRSADSGFVALLSNGSRIEVVARVLRARDLAFAARDIAPGKVIEATDLDIRKVDVDQGERAAGIASLIGSTTAVRIRQGALIAPSDLRMKPVVKKGDLVRVVSSSYEVDGRALEDGTVGQEIGLEFVLSRNRVRATVVSASRVEPAEAGR